MRLYKIFFTKISLFSVLMLTQACSLGPDYLRPQTAIPQNYLENLGEGNPFAELGWWEIFEDPALQELIRQALDNNKDLLMAVARIEQAGAAFGITRADQFPRLELSGHAQRSEASREALAFKTGPVNDFGLFSNLSYELDFWGKLRKASEAKRSELLSSQYAALTVTMTLVSEVASAYLNILSLQDQLNIAEQTLKNRSGASALIKKRHEEGLIPQLDLNQAQIEEAAAGIALTESQRMLRQAENNLRVLLGNPSFEIKPGSKLVDYNFGQNLPSGYPVELLERRPDIKSAEEYAKAQVSNISVAMANRFPAINLRGMIGLQSIEDSRFFRGDARTWSIAGSLLGPIIDFGKVGSQIDLAEALAKEALLAYELKVIQAVREVEDALIAIKTSKQAYDYRKFQVEAASNAALLSRARYDEGVAPYMEVLDIERSLFEAELGASRNKELYLLSIIQLYKALGGGWQSELTLDS